MKNKKTVLINYYLLNLEKKNNDLRKWGTPFHIIIKNGNIENIGIVKGEFMIKEIEDFLTNKLMT